MSEAGQQQNDDAARTSDEDRHGGPLAELGSVTPETFEPHVEDKFQVKNVSLESQRTHVHPLSDELPGRLDEIVELTLVEVTRYPRIKERESGFEQRPREPFALLFQGPADQPLMSAELSVYHDQLGAGCLFFTPVQVSLKPEQDRPASFYEVVFG